jgi:MFS transporter, DHA1 family, multidrug resistance protein
MNDTKRSAATFSHRGMVLLLGSLAALGPFAIDTYLPAFPRIAQEFHCDAGRVGLSLAAYFLGICLGQLVYGPVLDRFGRRVPLLFGLGLFVVTSALCMLAPNVESLIALRFLQALGGCAGMVAGRALVMDLFPEEAAKIFSSLMLVMGVAPVIAPSLGGILVESFGWRSIFAFLAAVAGVVTAWIAWKLPETHRPDPSSSLRPMPVARGYLALFAHPEFLAYGVGGSLVSAGLFAYITGSPAVYMQVLGFSSRQFAWIFALNAVALIGASQVNRWWLGRSGERQILDRMLSVQAVLGILLLVAAWWRFTPGIVVLVWLFMACQGLLMPNIGALAMRPFGRTAGSASALLGSLQMAAGALLAAIVSTLPSGSALPMASGMVLSAVGGYALLRWLRRQG